MTTLTINGKTHEVDAETTPVRDPDHVMTTGRGMTGKPLRRDHDDVLRRRGECGTSLGQDLLCPNGVEVAVGATNDLGQELITVR